MNFEDDDLLADILSDGSNDSFFDDPRLTTKKSLNKNSEKSEVKKESTSEDWLGLGTSSRDVAGTKSDIKTSDDWLGIGKTDPPKESEITKSPAKTRKPVKKISFEDDDILGTLGITKKSAEENPKETTVPSTREKKSDFLESILKPSKKEENFDDILKPSFTRPRNDGEPKVLSTNLTTKVETQELSIGASLTQGRRKRVTSGLVDPLGLFSNESKEEPMLQVKTSDGQHGRAHSFSAGDIKDIDTVSSTKSNFGDTTRSAPNLLEASGLPDWLANTSKLKSTDTDWGAVSSTKSKSDITLSDKTETVNAPERQSENIQPNLVATRNEDSTSQANLLGSLLAHQKMAQSQMEYQNTAISLQQQESQILMALQMKKYEDNLMEIQRQQQEILVKQEQQFNALLERQFAKQHAMENNMRLQQERINNHIQLLLAQPRVATPVQHLKEEMEKARESAEEEHIKSYENMISNLKQRQHEELFILEESYKKQILMLEDTSGNIEKRLKDELEAALARNEANLKVVQEDHEKEMNNFKRKIEDIEEQHAKEMKLIRENHLRVIDEIKYEHNLIVDNIKESKRSEAALLKDSGEFGQKLDANIQLLYNNSQILQNVSEQIETDHGIFKAAKEETMKAKEREIEMMRNALEKCRESAEMERVQMLGLVRSLETKISEQSHAAKEERWALQQAVSTLATRAAAFDRETEFARASIEREREQLKALRESLLAEQEKVMLQLTEEKLSVSAEKSRLQTTSKLNVQYDSQKAKAELEAAIQVAKEAAEMTDRERETLQRQICEVESLKRTLQDKERKLNSREIDLARLSQIAEEKSQEGEKALQEAGLIEMRFNERMKQLQFQLLQLSNREKKITEEKISLSKERIALNTLMRQRRTCSLCSTDAQQIDLKSNNWNNDYDREEVPQFPRFDVSEAEILRLQFEDKEEHNDFKNKQ
ncbi:hypothetical protein HHI36_020523 [Cryptolaemus montrouzieri]|uniref:Fas-binding factor 1 C-terminal domain-containing protein n=1 Tax=Cryptolaemus montrouzieri TaxID=559131 RepID=A0ABD2NAL8_9CUCU